MKTILSLLLVICVICLLPAFERRAIAMATSTLVESESDPDCYSAAKAFDDDPATCWVEAKKDDGTGETVGLLFNYAVNIDGIEIITGFARNKKMWADNNRPSKITVTIMTDTVPCIHKYEFALNDSMEIQKYFFPDGHIKNVIGASVTIDSVYKGNKYNDTCFSELGFITKQGRKIEFTVTTADPKSCPPPADTQLLKGSDFFEYSTGIRRIVRAWDNSTGLVDFSMGWAVTGVELPDTRRGDIIDIMMEWYGISRIPDDVAWIIIKNIWEGRSAFKDVEFINRDGSVTKGDGSITLPAIMKPGSTFKKDKKSTVTIVGWETINHLCGSGIRSLHLVTERSGDKYKYHTWRAPGYGILMQTKVLDGKIMEIFIYSMFY